MMNNFIVLSIMLVFLACSTNQEKPKIYNGSEILNKSIAFHDPNNKWSPLDLAIHIQEPRISNPSRYSLVKLNNQNGAFELIRNRDHHLSKHVVSENGELSVYLDDSEDFDQELIEQYRLDPERNKVYRNFYAMMYGLPMTLNRESINTIGEVETCIYNNQKCYRIPIELKEEMFSKNWLVYISSEQFEIKGIEIIFPEDQSKGERLYFDGSFSINEIRIPRTRHWHELVNNEYLGSDIIIKEIKD